MLNIIDAIESVYYRKYQVQIQFRVETNFTYYHGAKLYDFLCKSLKRNRDKLGDDIILEAPESGTILYKKGDFYNFGVTKFGKDEKFKDEMTKGIDELSRFRVREHGLEGRYDLIFIKELPKVEIPDLKLHDDDLYHIRFVSPFRMEREKETVQKGHKYFDLEYFDINRFIKLIYFRLKRLTEKFGTVTLAEEIPVLETDLINMCFHWVDMPYPQKTLGGLVGKLHFHSNMCDSLKYALWFGQIFNSGNNVSFGFGKYTVENSIFHMQSIKPHSGMLHRILDYDNMYSAYLHIKQNTTDSKTGELDIRKFEENLNSNLMNLIMSVRHKEYEPEILKGVKLRKSNGDYRYLAIPSIDDRILQRAVCQVLSPSFDALLEESSFAYRKGFSRQSAATAIMKYNEQGYNYALKTDIESFFDSVNWKLMFDKTDALIQDPLLYELIVKWITAPVYYRNVKISRSLGLPQGNAISPLLANLYLDEFDELIQSEFKLIRYCDDFVILCKSTEDAEQAKNKVKESLKKFFLELNIEKTKITSFSEGFNYLGFLFTEAEVFQSGKKGNILLGLKSKENFNDTWLNAIKTKNISEVNGAVTGEYLFSDCNSVNINSKSPVYVSGYETRVTLSDGKLIFSNQAEGAENRIPLSRISMLCFLGTPNSSIQSVLKLSELNVPVFFCRADGKVLSAIGTKNDYLTWKKQSEFIQQNERCLEFAKKVVYAKINNSKVIAYRNKWDAVITDKLNSFLADINSAPNLNTLLGIEGIASKNFFEGMRKDIPEGWGFKGRMKHPAGDPVNALLSFGYTIIYNHLSASLMMAGLNPEIGIYHKVKSGHNSLASDLLEEFRHIINSFVLYIIHRNILSPNDFEYASDDKLPVRLIKEKRKLFVSLIEKRLREEYNFEKENMNYIEYFYKKGVGVRKLIYNPDMEYKPFIIR